LEFWGWGSNRNLENKILDEGRNGVISPKKGLFKIILKKGEPFLRKLGGLRGLVFLEEGGLPNGPLKNPKRGGRKRVPKTGGFSPFDKGLYTHNGAHILG